MLETLVGLSLRDVGKGGVLVDSPVPLTVGALHKALFSCDGAEESALRSRCDMCGR